MDEPQCLGCRDLLRRLEAAERRIADLEARLAQNASNSSLPPSANPPDAPKPVVKKPTGRKPGAQPGHPAHLRQRLPAERLSAVIDFVPGHCRRCRADLPAQPGANDPAPAWHQVVELPARLAEVTEYRGHARTCPGCGALTHAPVPADIRRHAVGPRLAAFLVYLRGAHQVSQRGLEEIVAAALDVPLSLGAINHLERQAAAALAPAHAEALQAVRAAPVKHVDETGWKRAGRWLWLAASATVAVFVVHARRGAAGLTALLGETITGLLCTDRWAAYDRLPPLRRQGCWAHLRRDFQKLVDRGGAAAPVGRSGLRVAKELFACWHRHRDGPLDRDRLLEDIAPLARRLDRTLSAGRRCADGAAAAFCDNLLALWPALWLFSLADGVEPTNNHAERLLRRAVLWRKRSFGSHSADGCRLVERLLTTVQTLRLQGRAVLTYLHDAIAAHRAGQPAPKLLTEG